MMKECIELTRFIGAEIEEREVHGRMEKCVSIPIKLNGLVTSKDGRIFLNLNLFPRKPNMKGDTHFVSVSFANKELQSKVKELGYEEDLKFIGFIRKGRESRNTLK